MIGIDYGIEVNRKLYWYFKYVKDNYRIRLFRQDGFNLWHLRAAYLWKLWKLNGELSFYASTTDIAVRCTYRYNGAPHLSQDHSLGAEHRYIYSKTKDKPT